MAKKKRRRLDFDIIREYPTNRIYYSPAKFRGMRHSKLIGFIELKGIRYWSNYI